MSTEHDPIGTIRRESHGNGNFSVWLKVEDRNCTEWLCVLSTAPGNRMQSLSVSTDMSDYPIIGVIDIRLNFVVTGFNPPLVTQ